MKLNNVDAYLCIYELQADGTYKELRGERRLLLSRLLQNPVKNSTKKAGYYDLSKDIKPKPKFYQKADKTLKATLQQQRGTELIEYGGWLKYQGNIVKGVDFESKYSGENNTDFIGIPLRPDKFDSN